MSFAFQAMQARQTNAPAVVLLSGGLDSATVLAIAKKLGYAPYALSFRYGQRHSSELDAAVRVAQSLGAIRHEIIDLDLRRFVGGSALTDDAYAVPTSPGPQDEIPITYVPARNTIMLSVALGWAEALGGLDIFFGANAVDYSGYPDCRPEYVKSFEATANLATKVGVESHDEATRFRVHAPIINMSKAEIIKTGMELGVVFSQTVSCYQANPEGLACGQCESCRLRREGFKAAGIPDPTHYAK
jgi:7-cyano-7-deazaguanine synthase